MELIAENSEKQPKRFAYNRLLTGVSLCLVGGMLLASPAQAQVFDFEGISTDPRNVTALPRLGTANDDAVLAELLARQDAGKTVAARVMGQGLTPPQQAFWFQDSGLNFDYVFGDFEGLLSVTRAVDLVRGSNNPNAYVGNFALDPLNPDSTQPNPNSGASQTGYVVSGVNMSNEVLYPGSPTFVNVASGNSTGPNVRSDLMTQPLARFGGVEAQRGETIDLFGQTFEVFPDDHKHIPYVTRFNNYGNNDLNNTDVAINPDTNEPYPFQYDTDDQLLSRGDFSAQVAHLRLRGADGVVLFQPGVLNVDPDTGEISEYTKLQQQQDAVDGWDFLQPFIGTDVESVTEGVEGVVIEEGVVWSGAITESGNSLLLLLSNLDENTHDVVLPDQLADLALSETVFDVAGGDHILLEFIAFDPTQSGNPIGWAHVETFDVFEDDARGGIGVPEPASLVMLAIGGLLVGLPRSVRRR